ncbi:hypothetical protein HZ326_19826 [Fusarium oxysporum f. sp. albedinis]|nr:hypothetical protein HZ326_19826 [Fusarium oxysporum f. sp. albedinis]
MTTLHHKVQSCQEKEIGQSSMLSLLILTSFQTSSSTSNKQSTGHLLPPVYATAIQSYREPPHLLHL